MIRPFGRLLWKTFSSSLEKPDVTCPKRFFGRHALFYSLNPSLFLAQFYLIATPKPVPRLFSYIAGVLLVNFLGGLLLLSGFQVLVATFLQNLGGGVLYSVQLALGLGLLLFGLRVKANPRTGHEPKKPRSLSLAHTFLLGMVVMLNEITTALPYFFAVERIVRAQLPVFGDLLALVLYNFVFALPLLGFLGVFFVYRKRFSSQLERITQAVQRWTPRIVKYGSVAFGAVLALNAALYFTVGRALF